MQDEVIMPPVPTGEILLTEFLEPLELSQYQLARSIAVPPRRINEIVHGQRRSALTQHCAWLASLEPPSGSG
jgi:addiction module HigA family antidote